MDREEALARLRSARVARLATVRPDGSPHVVPFVFALVDDSTVYWAVDDKPKRSSDLQRLRNIDANPAVELVADGYDDDWAELWWVRASGTARRVADPAQRARALAALQDKYPRYRERPPEGEVVAIDLEAVSSWSAGG